MGLIGTKLQVSKSYSSSKQFRIWEWGGEKKGGRKGVQGPCSSDSGVGCVIYSLPRPGRTRAELQAGLFMRDRVLVRVSGDRAETEIPGQGDLREYFQEKGG